MAISIIVPVLNEERNLRTFLCHLRECCPQSEIVVADGGSKDGSVEIAQELANTVLSSGQGRAVQMNAAAKVAQSDIFWFVHADSTITPALPRAIETALDDPDIAGGCFRLRLDSPRKIYRLRDAIGNRLVDLTGIALGDRGFFCRREAFLLIGGYPEIEILEDAEFYRKLRQRGRVVQLAEVIGSSARRYEALGAAPTMCFYSLIMLLYCARVPIRILEGMVRAYMARRER